MQKIKHTGIELGAALKMKTQHKWQRILLLIVLAYEAAGCLLGGGFLVAAPDGHIMAMPVSIMHGTFSDFLIPGIILFGLGVLNLIAFISVLRRGNFDWVWASLALGGLTIWFIVEITIVRELVWLHFIWGLPVYAGILAGVPLLPSRYSEMRNAALMCGILSTLLYVAMNIFIPMQWAEYNSASQTVSELSAVGAPTRPIWVWLGIIYELLTIAFAWAVWKSGKGNRALRIAGGLLLAYAILGIFWPFAPMHLREVLAAGGSTASDTMHLALGAITEIIYLLALGFAAAAFGKQFRYYSIATFIVLLIFGALTFLDAPGVSTNQPTPLIGVWERINIGIFMLWVVILATNLLRKRNTKLQILSK